MVSCQRSDDVVLKFYFKMTKHIKTFFAVYLAATFVSSLDPVCRNEHPTNRMLHNLDKLLNLKKVKIVEGITLKRKLEKLRSDSGISSETCRNVPNDFMQQLQGRLDDFMTSHILEFDLASVLTKGKQ